VVDHQIDRDLRVDPLRIAAQPHHGRAHRRQVHHTRYAREILKDHAGALEGNLLLRGAGRVPAGQQPDVLFEHIEVVQVPQHGLQQDADRVGQAVEPGQAGPLERVEPPDPHLASHGSQRGNSSECVAYAHRKDSGACRIPRPASSQMLAHSLPVRGRRDDGGDGLPADLRAV